MKSNLRANEVGGEGKKSMVKTQHLKEFFVKWIQDMTVIYCYQTSLLQFRCANVKIMCDTGNQRVQAYENGGLDL